jgi:hypothetical protein
MLPLSVMNVIPMATQPMKEAVFKSENKLTFVKKPGVPAAAATSANKAAKRIPTNTRPRPECGSGRLQVSRETLGNVLSVMRSRPLGA